MIMKVKNLLFSQQICVNKYQRKDTIKRKETYQQGLKKDRGGCYISFKDMLFNIII